VDESLSELERAVRERPGDADAARRLERALLRAGQPEAVQARYRFKFACPRTWDSFAPTANPEVRRCDGCARLVYQAADPADLADLVAAGECVAVDPATVGGLISNLAEHPLLHSAEEEGRPCVLEAPYRPAPAPPMLAPGGLMREPPPFADDPPVTPPGT